MPEEFVIANKDKAHIPLGICPHLQIHNLG